MLSRPRNIELDTYSEFIFAIDGAFIEPKAFVAPAKTSDGTNVEIAATIANYRGPTFMSWVASEKLSTHVTNDSNFSSEPMKFAQREAA
jgi:hypothetical protein